MISKSVRLLLTTCVASIAFTSLQAVASQGSVNLMATLRDAPAFTPVEWKVMRMDNSSVPLPSSHTHSMSFPIDSGTYRAVATYNGISRERVFTVPPHGRANVVMAMD